MDRDKWIKFITEEIDYDSIECGERPMMNIPTKTIIPVSRFRRELKKWMRYIDKNPDEVLFLTRNNISASVITSPEWYENVRKEIEAGILNAC